MAARLDGRDGFSWFVLDQGLEIDMERVVAGR